MLKQMDLIHYHLLQILRELMSIEAVSMLETPVAAIFPSSSGGRLRLCLDSRLVLSRRRTPLLPQLSEARSACLLLSRVRMASGRSVTRGGAQ